MALIASEMYSELGVGVSRKCHPRKVVGPVLTYGTRSGGSKVKQALAAFKIRRTDFLDGNVASAAFGFPVKFSGRTCLSCLNATEDITVVSNCSVRNGKTFPAGSLFIGAARYPSIFNVIAAGFKTMSSGNETRTHTFAGDGDLTFCDEHYAMFIMHGLATTDDATEVGYMEYSDQVHCKSLLDKMLQQPTSTNLENSSTWEVTRAPVRTQIIRCEKNTVGFESFRAALQLYRSFQLEDDFSPAPFNKETKSFPPITNDDVYRAVLSLLLWSAKYEQGEYYEYTECGLYRWVFLLPFFLCISVLVCLGALALFLFYQGNVINVPYSSKTWFKEALRKNEDYFEEREQSSALSARLFDSRYDEMYVVGDQSHDIHVKWFDRWGLHKSYITGSREAVCCQGNYFKSRSGVLRTASLVQNCSAKQESSGDVKLNVKTLSFGA